MRLFSDGTYYGMVMSVRVSVRPSVRLSVRPLKIRTFVLHTLKYWAKILHKALFQCTVDQVECRHFVSIIEGIMPLWDLEYLKYAVIPHFSPTCFDI